MVDGWVLTRNPAEIFAARQEWAIPLLFGTTTREFEGNQTPDQLREMITMIAGEHATEALRVYGLANGEAGVN